MPRAVAPQMFAVAFTIICAVAICALLVYFRGNKTTAYWDGAFTPEAQAKLDRIDSTDFRVTAPLQLRVGRPRIPPTDQELRRLGEALLRCGVKDAYWAWVSIAGDEPHLGLALSPYDDVTRDRIGELVVPIWQDIRPKNPYFDAFAIGSPPSTDLFATHGLVLLRNGEFIR